MGLDARCKVSLAGGVERLKEEILCNHLDAIATVDPYIDMLGDLDRLEEVRSFTDKQLDNIREELDGISSAKHVSQEYHTILRESLPPCIEDAWAEVAEAVCENGSSGPMS